MYVIVGLGNPGDKYRLTRHNIGFLIIDELSKEYNIKVDKIKHKSLIGSGFINGEKVLLVKPQTFMNNSGEAVQSLVNYYNLDLEKLIIIYDDIDIDVGKVRIRKKGSAGSHNGMKSIIQYLKNPDFPRIRIGVGRPINQNLASFVLSKFPKEEIDPMVSAIEVSVKSIDELVKNGIDLAMNKYNKN